MIVPLYRENGQKNECMRYRDISLLSFVQKVYERILIEHIRKIGEERCCIKVG